jgi:biotin carboxyl carrier protein
MTKNLRITVEGKTYDVTVEIPDDEIMHAPRPGGTGSGSGSGGGGRRAASAATPTPSAPAPSAPSASGAPGEIVSPLSGVVSEVHFKVGDSVKEGDTVVTLEAMKMMTSVPASSSGTVKQVLVESGQSVEEGQPIMILE